jgi:hypothetical protein
MLTELRKHITMIDQSDLLFRDVAIQLPGLGIRAKLLQ